MRHSPRWTKGRHMDVLVDMVNALPDAARFVAWDGLDNVGVGWVVRFVLSRVFGLTIFEDGSIGG